MNGRKSFILILVALFASQTIFVFSSGSMNYTYFSAPKSSLPREDELLELNAVSGVENIKSNVMRDGGFEEDDSYDGPEHFWYWGTGYEICNSTYQDDVHGGSYGMFYSVQGTDQQSSNIYIGRGLTYIPERAYLDQDISLDMWFKVKSNPDFTSNAYSNMYIRIWAGSQNYYLYYYFSRSSALPGNNSNNCHFDVREPVGSWVNLQRNLTHDFEAAFPSVPITSSVYATYIYFRAYSVLNPTGPIEMLIDDVSIKNSTTFDFMHENGDFEDGNGYRWYSFSRGPSSVKLSDDDYTEGSSSLNLTASAFYEGGSSYGYCEQDMISNWGVAPDAFYPTESGAVTLDFDWKYSDTLNGGYNQEAFFYLYFENNTFGAYLYFMLGEESDTLGYGNTTQPSYIYRYYEAPGFGNRDTWEHFSLDFYDISQEENLQNVIPTYFGWSANAADTANSTVQLLVDDLNIVADPLGDPSFEQAKVWDPNDPLNSWSSTSHTYTNRTTDAHTGTYAANVTSHSSLGNAYCYRHALLPTETNQYTDFWWRLDEITGPSTAYSYIYLELDDNKYLNYILGKSAVTSFTNSSDQYYFYPENFNQTGVWNNLFRNITNDAYAAFGVDNWNITEVRVGSYAVGASKASALFDDMYFVRDVTGPELTNLGITPTVPQYGQAVNVEVDVIDNFDVLAVELHYKIGAGSWQATPMTYTVSYYESIIPSADWGTVVQYYIAAYDVHGYQTLLGSDITPYQYTVADLIDPILVVEAPLTTDPILGSVQFNISGDDPGSGITSFVIEIGTVTVHSEATILPAFIWDTTEYVNGNYTITFTLTDGASNSVQIVLEYVIENPIPWYIRAKDFIIRWWPYLTAGVGTLLVGTFVIALVVRRRRKLTV
ncbi:MAG: hypothetical protein E3J70_04025 [Candidatus Heimdallarchaeota archaeon]|nr:MAG: hypothetical protein E3J70_04025 [Candidatus Heimdallarchaeota archaeon]